MEGKVSTKPLTQFQEHFCLQFIKSGCASDAYRAVSPNSKSWTNNALWVTSSKMMAKPQVGLRIAHLRATMATRAIASAESLADELDKAIELAARKNQCGVVVTAIIGKAKLFGLLSHKKKTRSSALDDLSIDEIRMLEDVINAFANRESVG
jgi:phage terminase small subunit